MPFAGTSPAVVGDALPDPSRGRLPVREAVDVPLYELADSAVVAVQPTTFSAVDALGCAGLQGVLRRHVGVVSTGDPHGDHAGG